jgi:hypothetical protein
MESHAPNRESHLSYPVLAALELTLALAGHGDGRGTLLELAGAGLPMGLTLTVVFPLAPVLLHHVVFGPWRRADGARRRRRGRGRTNPLAPAFKPHPMPGDPC